MKHKHCDLIKAWADGASIQHYSKKDGRWIDNTRPTWSLDCEWRIKPKEEYLRFKVGLFRSQSGELFINAYEPKSYEEMRHAPNFVRWIMDEQIVKVEWMRAEK